MGVKSKQKSVPLHIYKRLVKELEQLHIESKNRIAVADVMRNELKALRVLKEVAREIIKSSAQKHVPKWVIRKLQEAMKK